MNKCTQLFPFVRDLFDDQARARKATRIVAGIMQARCPRLSEIAREMSGNEEANYKCIQCFLDATDPNVLRPFHLPQAQTRSLATLLFLLTALPFLRSSALSELMSELEVNSLFAENRAWRTLEDTTPPTALSIPLLLGIDILECAISPLYLNISKKFETT